MSEKLNISHDDKSSRFGEAKDEDNTDALLDRVMAFDNVVISKGVYSNYNFSQSNKTINFEAGAIFKLPDNTTDARSKTPVPTILISGDNLTFNGKIVVDGNFSNNPSDNMNTSLGIGAVHITGKNTTFNNVVEINNASWVGLSFGSEANAASNIYMSLLVVNNPYYYATSFWNVDTYMIDRIHVTKGVDTWDARIRIGSGNSSNNKSKNGMINSIVTNHNLILEVNTEETNIGNVICKAAKTEKAKRVNINSIICKDEDGDSFSFAMIESENINIGSVIVKNHNGDRKKAVAFSKVVNCTANNIQVTGTINNASDVEIRSADGLIIDKMILTDPVGNGKGFFFDYDEAYAPQKGIRIRNIISKGHKDLDVNVQKMDVVDISINDINADAKTNIRLKNKSSLL